MTVSISRVSALSSDNLKKFDQSYKTSNRRFTRIPNQAGWPRDMVPPCRAFPVVWSCTCIEVRAKTRKRNMVGGKAKGAWHAALHFVTQTEGQLPWVMSDEVHCSPWISGIFNSTIQETLWKMLVIKWYWISYHRTPPLLGTNVNLVFKSSVVLVTSTSYVCHQMASLRCGLGSSLSQGSQSLF